MQDPSPSPWRVLGSTPLLEDRWIKLRADRLQTAAGVEIAPWYVLEYPDWAVVVALTEDRRVVLVRQWRHAAQAWSLELPGGVMDATDADAVATARRELREETGFDAAEWRFLYAAHPNPAIQTNRLHVVLATGAYLAGDTAREDGEAMTVDVLDIPAVLALVRAGSLGQSMHVGAILVALDAAGEISL